MVTCLHGRFTSAKGGALTYHDYAKQAVETLLHTFYDGRGHWRMCVAVCRSNNQDWGADALTYTLFLHWQTTHDAAVVRYFQALEQTAPMYGPPCTSAPCKGWSDVPEWDSVAALRDYEVTADPIALDKAKAAYQRVEGSHAYALGACPGVRYQVPFGGGGGLKTLETDANAIKAGLLLYRFTKESAYLTDAMKRYAAVRQYFLDPQVPLYSVYLYDNGTTCTQLPRRFFASVNGLMTYNGFLLAQLTGKMTYSGDAQATASAISQNLADARGIYEDLQAENDVVEPLVESMYDLADTGNSFARAWIMTNAAAAVSARKLDGSYGRLFGGPPPSSPVTSWQTNGGLSLEIAASALSGKGSPAAIHEWQDATFVENSVTKLPATLHFTGSRIALIGTLGEVCCQPGHARVFIDGRETFDKTGIWQNKSSSGHTFPNALLFAWQWHSTGKHTLQFYPGVDNPKEGPSFLHLQRYFFR
ncbi:MAG: hypothetical protein M3Z14_06865 [Candidatus Eremiobacteraeota bacterium]|nr:hypothetical protein [Candidatus Eremiobacteraeota bacterium]